MTTLNPTLNFDARETRVVSNPDTSPMFSAQPIYARTPKKKASNNLALLVGAPVVLVAAGAIAWMLLANPAQTPASNEPAAQMEVARSETLTPPLAPEVSATAPMSAPVQTAAIETPAPSAAAPVRAQRPVAARRAAPVERAAPDATSASSNVSATVPAPAPIAAAPVPIVAEPPPLVIPAPTAPEPVLPVAPQ